MTAWADRFGHSIVLRRDFIGLVVGWTGGLVPVLFISALARYVG
jgi:hypothetical protein